MSLEKNKLAFSEADYITSNSLDLVLGYRSKPDLYCKLCFVDLSKLKGPYMVLISLGYRHNNKLVIRYNMLTR